MGRKRKEQSAAKEPTALELEIAKLRGIPRGERSESDNDRLAELLATERRGRWNRLSPGRFKRLRGALKGLIQLANPASYQYTPEEAQAVVDALDKRVKQVRAAFLGAPEEKGMFDL